ncbi:MAG TPA: dTDP-glucose 4,6-dehydratase [Candidatus Nitrosotenuis sp.]|nr:dTDP-glucose 4,6-dehydratase [Candidatus Nitrosotenuis sp.]
MNILVTGGAGFIGSNFVRGLLERRGDARVVVFDKLTYAGNLENLQDCCDGERCRFIRGDIADAAAVANALTPDFDAVVNFAAETHVDRSIEDAQPFLRTNVTGTFTLLEATRRARVPRFVQVSTDEVYGPAEPGTAFAEDGVLRPSSPYAASKAAADLLVRACGVTYGLSAVIVRLSNVFGPRQFPEKLIPLAIAHASDGKPVPLYGDGLQERDWLFVDDACRGIECALERGRPGETYHFATGTTRPNLEVVLTILRLLGRSESLVQFVQDRPGHDRRYALDTRRAHRELAWRPQIEFDEGIRRTIEWYRENSGWLARARSGEYRQYYERHYAYRESLLRNLGVAGH